MRTQSSVWISEEGGSKKKSFLSLKQSLTMLRGVATSATGAFSGAFGNVENMNDSELRALFDTIDTDGGGTLDKDEITQALRKANKPKRDIQKLLDRLAPSRPPILLGCATDDLVKAERRGWAPVGTP